MISNTSVRATVNTIVLYVKLLLSTVIALFNVPLLLRALGVENYGIFCVVGGVISLLMFLNATMSTATNRFLGVIAGKKVDLSRKQSVFLHCFYIHSLVAVILFLGFEIIAFFFWDRLLNISPSRLYAAKIVFQTMAVTTFFSVATVPHNGVVIINERMIFVAIVTLAASVAKLGITFLLFRVNSDKLIAYAVLLLMVHLAERAAYVLCAHHLESIRYGRLEIDRALLKEMATFFGWSMTINFSLPAVINGTSILLNRFFGVLVNAAEGIATQVAGQLGGVCGSLQNAVTPIIMKKQGGGEYERALAVSLTSCRMSVYLLSLAGVTVFWEMPYLLKIWLKTVPEYAVIFCRLILLRLLVEQSTLPLAVLMNANGNIKMMQLPSSIIYLSTLAVEYLVLRNGGVPYSVYFCCIAMMASVGVVRVLCVKKYYGLSIVAFLRDNLLRESGVLFFGAIAGGAVVHLFASSLWRCALCLLCSCAVLCGSILWFGIIGEERKIIYGMFHKLKQKVICP